MILNNNNSMTRGRDQAWFGQFIRLKVVDEAVQNVLFFIQHRTEPLTVLKSAYSDYFGLVASSQRFIVKGHLIEDTDTPWSLELENSDLVEVFQLEFLPLELPEFLSPPPPPPSPEMTMEQHINEIETFLT